MPRCLPYLPCLPNLLLQTSTIPESFIYEKRTIPIVNYDQELRQYINYIFLKEYQNFLQRCIEIVEEYIGEDEFSIKILAKEIGMSHSGLYKKIKLISGLSASSFIRYIRLRRAAVLMLTANANINEAAFQVGINDPKYFREQFRKLFGMNPSEYIRQYRHALSVHPDTYTES